MRILITGMSGTGKSSVIEALAAMGFRAVDMDWEGWSELDATGDWVWREDRVRELLDSAGTETLFICGCASNQRSFYGDLDHVVLLSAPESVLLERVRSRNNNPYGKRPEEAAEILENLRTVEPLLRRRASIEIDTRASLDEVVARVLSLVDDGH